MNRGKKGKIVSRSQASLLTLCVWFFALARCVELRRGRDVGSSSRGRQEAQDVADQSGDIYREQGLASQV